MTTTVWRGLLLPGLSFLSRVERSCAVRRVSLSLLIALALTGCGGSSTSTPTTPSPPPVSPTVAGNWRGSWASSRGGGGTFVATLAQTNTVVCPTTTSGCFATVTGSPCFSGSTQGIMNGTMSGNTLTLTVVFDQLGNRDEERPRGRYTGVLSANGQSMSGQYTVFNGPEAFFFSPCAGDTGTWNATKQF